MADTPDLPPLPTDLTIFTKEYTEKIRAYAREAVRLAARASVPAGWKLVPVKATTAQRLAMAGADDESGDRYRLMAAAMLAASPAAPTPPDEASDALDAARYRWLRDKSVPPHNFYISVPVEFEGVRYTPAEVDAGIDAARSTAA